MRPKSVVKKNDMLLVSLLLEGKDWTVGVDTYSHVLTGALERVAEQRGQRHREFAASIHAWARSS